jgi:hypothetical protein
LDSNSETPRLTVRTLPALRRADLDVERRHPLVVGEAEELGEQAQVRLPALEDFLAVGRIEDVVVVGRLEQTDVFLDEELIVLQ